MNDNVLPDRLIPVSDGKQTIMEKIVNYKNEISK
ncbi:hypothetical protein EZS27_010384 [termite gut metagenome]|uniref:Uncharacterized protein n=1 Tax=termite gut metagenome TaxID=433724 RepID=A0A5J4S905_9ZZZZ